MPSLDTNCLLRWLLDDVPSDTARVDQLIASSRALTVADVALIEVVFVLERVLKVSRAAIVETFSVVVAEKTLVFDRPLWQSVIDDFNAHPKLSVADIYLTHEARRENASPLVTSDAKLARQLDGAALVPQPGRGTPE